MSADEQSFSGVRSVLPGSLKALLKSALDSPLLKPLRKLYAGLGSALVYHRITEYKNYEVAWRDPNVFSPHLGLSVHTERFRSQLQFIKKYCTPLSLHELSTALSKRSSRKPYVLVTFDDGYLDNLKLALPIAEEVGVPIAVFVTTGFISRQSSPWWLELEALVAGSSEITTDGKTHATGSVAEKRTLFIALEHCFRRLSSGEQVELIKKLNGQFSTAQLDDLFMNWDQLQELSSHPLVTIGAHTMHHPVLSQESRGDAKQEMSRSQRELQDRLGITVPMFAYPYGDAQAAGEREEELAEDCGFTSSFTTRAGHLFAEHQNSPQMIPRITVDYFDDDKGFQRKLSGVESICTEPFSRVVTY